MRKQNKLISENVVKYELKYKEVIVTYHDGVDKSFTPTEWAIFEQAVRLIAKKIIVINHKNERLQIYQVGAKRPQRNNFIQWAKSLFSKQKRTKENVKD